MRITETEVLIDLSNPPQKVRWYGSNGLQEEVLCQRHFLKGFDSSKQPFVFNHWILEKIEKAEDDEPCFDCQRNN